jgi:translation initiation factor IF-2
VLLADALDALPPSRAFVEETLPSDLDEHVLAPGDSNERASEIQKFLAEIYAIDVSFSALKDKQTVLEYPVVIKADVQGSAEVLADTLTKLTDEKVKIRIIHAGVGAVNESDVLLASASNAIIIGFNVRPDRNAADVADREKVDIRQHSIIYNVTDEMKKAMAGLLEPTVKETRMGSAEVRQVFKTPKAGTVAGCMVTDGRLARGGDAQARLLRDNVVVWTGKIAGLRRFKDDVSEVKNGFECGVSLDRFNDIKVGDVIEVITVEKIAQTIQ